MFLLRVFLLQSILVATALALLPTRVKLFPKVTAPRQDLRLHYGPRSPADVAYDAEQ